MQTDAFKRFMESAQPITSFRVGTKVVDISGRIVTVNRHESNITWVYLENALIDCYANCACVIAFDQPTLKED